MDKMLALDVGTSYLKGALVDRKGNLCALAKVRMPISHPSPGLWEMPAGDFLQTLKKGVSELNRESPDGLNGVAAVTFASQSNSFLLLNENDSPLTPIIIWGDERARGMDDAIRQINSLPGFQRTTGVPGLGCEYMAAKLLWFQEQRADIWRNVRRICLISDYLTHWLTGRHVTEGAVAGMAGGIDIHRMAWWPAFCDVLGLPAPWLPAVARAGAELGGIRPQVAAELGLPDTCRFVVGCLDQYAGAIGVGNVVPGSISETTGTVLATVRCSATFDPQAPSHVFQGPTFDPTRYYQLAFGTTSASLLERYVESLPERISFEQLMAEAADIAPGADGLRLDLDAFERRPEAGFAGWGPHHTPAHVFRCIMETVAYALDDQVRLLSGNERPSAIRSAGGGARSDVWLQIKADVLGLRFERTSCPAPACLGAAILGAAAMGWGTVPNLADQWVQVVESYGCRPDLHDTYAAIRAEGRTLAKSKDTGIR